MTRIQRSSPLLAVLLVAAASIRLVSSYGTFSQTFDEPAHLACGIEFLDRGVYNYEAQHPPLARVALALGPYFSGVRSIGLPSMWDEGNALLGKGDDYTRILSLARAGILPFFWLASLAVFLWANRVAGRLAALVAVLLFTTTPPVLAHSGLATTDMAITAFLLLALYATVVFAERPSWQASVLLAVAMAGAVLSKFTVFLFYPASAAGVAVMWLLVARPSRKQILWSVRIRARRIAAAAGLAALLIWAGYGFSLNQLSTEENRPHQIVTRVFGTEGALVAAANALVEMPLPGSELVRGIVHAGYHASEGHDSYLLGEYRKTGWIAFFPVVLAVKTPLGLLALFILGVAAMIRDRHRLSWPQQTPLIVFLAILLAVLPSKVNLGVRHILPIYGPMAIVGSLGAVKLLTQARHRYAPAAAGLLLVWHCLSSVMAHPDHLSYFNELAGRNPEEILVESDLDWGQDIRRLGDVLRSLNASEPRIALFTSADLRNQNLPPSRRLQPYEPVSGWVAISLTQLKMMGLKMKHESGRSDGPYDWLERYQPVAMAGRSIRIYHIPESQ